MPARPIDSTVEWLLAQLGDELGPIEARRMFGGHGIYRDDLMFIIVYEGRVYLKVDDETREAFETHGSGPFRPRSSQTLRSYYEVPPDVLEDTETLREWAQRAAEAAERLAR